MSRVLNSVAKAVLAAILALRETTPSGTIGASRSKKRIDGLTPVQGQAAPVRASASLAVAHLLRKVKTWSAHPSRQRSSIAIISQVGPVTTRRSAFMILRCAATGPSCMESEPSGANECHPFPIDSLSVPQIRNCTDTSIQLTSNSTSPQHGRTACLSLSPRRRARCRNHSSRQG